MTERASKAHFKSDESIAEVQTIKWQNYAQCLIVSLGLTDTKICSDIKAIANTARAEQQCIIIGITQEDHTGHILIKYNLVDNTDKIALTCTRVRMYNPTALCDK